VDNELTRYGKGTEVVPTRDRKVAKRARETVDEVRLAALKADGAMALGAHLMEGLVGLDDQRRSLSGGDPITDALLMEIEASTIRQCKGIQNNLYNGWST